MYLGNTVVVVLAGLVLLQPAFALDDVLGWQGTRWGMTEEEVAQALGNEAVPVSPPTRYAKSYAPFRVPLQVGPFKLDAILQFSNETRRLRQVLLRGDTDGITLWAQLRDLLTEKYGPPIQVGDKREWRFKSTIIELQSTPIIGRTSVRYYPTSDYKDEKSKL